MKRQPEKPEPATVAELLHAIDAFNKAHELDLQHPAPAAGEPVPDNPLLATLYHLATEAAKSLLPLVRVEIKTVLKPAAEK